MREAMFACAPADGLQEWRMTEMLTVMLLHLVHECQIFKLPAFISCGFHE
jgi:hypothetical protein